MGLWGREEYLRQRKKHVPGLGAINGALFSEAFMHECKVDHGRAVCKAQTESFRKHTVAVECKQMEGWWHESSSGRVQCGGTKPWQQVRSKLFHHG